MGGVPLLEIVPQGFGGLLELLARLRAGLLGGGSPLLCQLLGNVAYAPRRGGRIDFQREGVRLDAQTKFGWNESYPENLLPLVPRRTLLPGVVTVFREMLPPGIPAGRRPPG